MKVQREKSSKVETDETDRQTDRDAKFLDKRNSTKKTRHVIHVGNVKLGIETNP